MIFPLQPLLDGWRSQNHSGLIRVVLLDVDGCLTAGEASPLSLGVFEDLQQINKRAAQEPITPAITLCTGRQEPYVELMMQAIGGYLPAIWENGGGLFIPSEYRFELHPVLDAQRLLSLQRARQIVAEAVIRPGLAFAQPGKETSISLFPTRQSSIEQVYDLARTALEPLTGQYWAQKGLTCVEVLPVGISKGSGARWLLDELGLQPEQSLAVGDSLGDLDTFEAAGFGAAPADAAPEVKAAADYVAPRESSQGVLDILEWCIDRNRAGGEKPGARS